MDEEDFLPGRGAPFVDADVAVGGGDVAGAGKGIGRIGEVGGVLRGGARGAENCLVLM